MVADVDGQAAAAAPSLLIGVAAHVRPRFATDVTVQADIDALVAAVGDRWGRIDILAANAGIYPHIPFAELTPSAFDRLMAINVRGAVFVAQACIEPMRATAMGG